MGNLESVQTVADDIPEVHKHTHTQKQEAIMIGIYSAYCHEMQRTRIKIEKRHTNVTLPHNRLPTWGML